jgi:hypothetical protein
VANSSDVFTTSAPETAIIAATVNSALIRGLEKRGLVNVSDIRGEWETFRTTVVQDYQPGKNALVIAGSDKRAVVYGLYTLAEQCGQSPLVPASCFSTGFVDVSNITQVPLVGRYRDYKARRHLRAPSDNNPRLSHREISRFLHK